MLRPTRAPSTAKRRAPSRYAVVAAACALLLATGLVPAAAQTDSDAIRQRLERVEAEQAQLQESLTAATARVDDLTSRLALVRNRSDQLHAELDALRARSGRADKLVDTRIRDMYKGDRVNAMMAFATGTSLEQLTSRTHYLTALTRSNQQRFEEAVALIDATRARNRELAEVDARLDELVAEAAAAQDDLSAQFSQAGATHEQLQEDLARAEAEARRLAAEAAAKRRAAEQAARTAARQEAAREIAAAEAAERRAAAASRSADRARQAAASAPPPAPAPAPAPAPPPAPAQNSSADSADSGSSGGGSGTAPSSDDKACPQDNPRSFTDTWGAPRSGGRTHEGTDIFGARGGDVFAIVSGTVEWTQTGATSGLFLSLRGNDGHTYWYMHLQDFVAGAGQRVQAGQLIAHNGDTGNAQGTSPHIHFEYHPGGGSAVNPYPLLKAICG